ncbi:MAG TPA: DUF6585 family protein [Anaerolineales bacterium]|nr:DUF6585 family protein [Anaerolineales bacterium]
MSPPSKVTPAGNNSNPSLGKLVAIYRRRRLGWAAFCSLVLMGIAVVLAPLFYGFYRHYYGYTQHGPVAAAAWSRTWYLIALLGLVIFSIFILNILKKSRQFVALHTKGIRIRASDTISIPWERIRGLSYSTVQPKFMNYHLKPCTRALLFLDNGAFIRLDQHIQEFGSLVDRIRKSLNPILNARIKENFNRGEWVSFGSIMVNQAGLRIDNLYTAWQDIHKISITSGFLVVELANQTEIRIPVVKISNLELMLQIVQAGVYA